LAEVFFGAADSETDENDDTDLALATDARVFDMDPLAIIEHDEPWYHKPCTEGNVRSVIQLFAGETLEVDGRLNVRVGGART